jgi:hypothetical protein
MVEAMTTIVAMLVFFAGVCVCVWLDQRGKTRRREMDHVERMRAIELGRPLDDAEVARSQALGSIAVAVGISSFAAAVLATFVILTLMDADERLRILVVIWPLCALAGTGVAVGCVQALGRRRTPPPPREAAPKGLPSPSEQVTGVPRDSAP